MVIKNISNYLAHSFDFLTISYRTIIFNIYFFQHRFPYFAVFLTPKSGNTDVNTCRPDSVKILKAPMRWLWHKSTYLKCFDLGKGLCAAP